MGTWRLKFSALWLALAATTASARVYTFGIIGDSGQENEFVLKTRDSLLRSGVYDLILPGDNIYDLNLTYDELWDGWHHLGFDFRVVALGNHLRSYREEMAYFGMPAEYFTTRVGEIRFIVLNSDNESTAKEQAKFLDRTVAQATERFVFVVFHHPPYTISDHHSWQEKEVFHNLVRPVLLKHQDRLTALMVGHDHFASLFDMGNLPVIVSGAVAESMPTEPISYIKDETLVRTRWSPWEGHYWARLDVDDHSGEVWVNFVRTDIDDVACSMRIAPRAQRIKRDNCERTGRPLSPVPRSLD